MKPSPFSDISEPIFAVMVTGKSSDRMKFAENAINCFLQQTYPNRHLLIIDDSDNPVNIVNSFSDRIRLIRPQHRLSLGELRNIAIDLLDESVLWMPWDDDDWRGNAYMEEQYKALIGNNWDGCAPIQQTKYSFQLNAAWVHRLPKGLLGFSGSIMVRNNKKLRYPALPRHEDSAMWAAYIAEKKVGAWENDSSKYLRFIHLSNTSTHLGTNLPNRDQWNVAYDCEQQLMLALPLYDVTNEILSKRVCHHMSPSVYA